jgi:hypothetical protein
MKTNWLSSLERELGNYDDIIPKGFRTVPEWATLWKMGQSNARALIDRHVKNGRMEMKKFKRKRFSRFYRAVK